MISLRLISWRLMSLRLMRLRLNNWLEGCVAIAQRGGMPLPAPTCSVRLAHYL
jgi:hypothetical protein